MEIFCHLIKLAGYLFITFFVVVLWQPITALIKFYRDGIYETSSGKDKVKELRKRRLLDVAASRADFIETSIEATFEPLVQGYIIFPSIINITTRLMNSVKVQTTGDLEITFYLTSLEQAQLFSIVTSILSLAWCYSDYTSVRKHLQLDITISPFLRILMCIWMILLLVARLLAFMLFAVYWGPGNIYVLMVFAAIHVILALVIHLIFSEDIAFLKKGLYLKFFHNVMLNACSSMFFHNYLRLDEMPIDKKLKIKGNANKFFHYSLFSSSTNPNF